MTPRTQKTPHLRGFCEADEGTRTLDLLHGKETARVDWSRQEGRKRLCCALLCRGRVDRNRPQERRKPFTETYMAYTARHIRLISIAFSSCGFMRCCLAPGHVPPARSGPSNSRGTPATSARR